MTKEEFNEEEYLTEEEREELRREREYFESLPLEEQLKLLENMALYCGPGAKPLISDQERLEITKARRGQQYTFTVKDEENKHD